MLDIFEQDAFSVLSLTDAMREIKHVPGFISRRGLFQTSSVDTLDVAIEKDAEQNLMLVPSSPRGGPGSTFGRNRRQIRKLSIPHFQVNDAIYADEVQGVRAFGQERAVESLMTKIAERGVEASQFFALTEEWHRLKVLTAGQLLDADGSILYDYATEFGESLPAEINFDFDVKADGALRTFFTSIHRQMAGILDGLPFSGIEAICGDDFFDDFVANTEVRQTYLNHTGAAELRSAVVGGSGQNDTFGSVGFANITFHNYRGAFNGEVAVDTDKCHLYPLGVPGLFKTVYAPADYEETVSSMGQRLYAKQWKMENGKGRNLEYQSNVLHYCTRPRVLLSGRRT